MESRDPKLRYVSVRVTSRQTATLVLLAVWAATILLTWRIAENPFYEILQWYSYSERLAGGAAIYRDFQANYPPLSYWAVSVIMKLFPNSYAAVTAGTAFYVLLFLVASYRLSRLLLSRRDSVLVALCSYLGTNILLSSTGPTFFTYSFTYAGLPLFNWFVWLTARSLHSRRHRLLYPCLAGLLAGLCLYIKHERILGVLAVLFFIVVYRLLVRPRNREPRVVPLFATMLATAGLCWGSTILASGWFYVVQGFTAYGLLKGYAGQNVPTVVQGLFQLALLALQVALLALAALSLRASSPTPPVPWQRRMTGVFAVALLLGLALVGFEGWEIAREIRAFELSDHTALKQLAALALTMAGDRSPGMRVVIALAGRLCFSLVPAIFLLALIGLWLLAPWLKRRYRFARPVPPRYAWIALLFFAAGGVQFRWGLWRTEFGALSLLLPVLFYLAPRLAVACIRPPVASALRRLRSRYAAFWLAGLSAASLGLYLFEFRDARWRPLTLNTDKGAIYIPDTPMGRSYSDLLSFLRRPEFADRKIISTPFDGLEYWFNRPRTPLMWIQNMPGWDKPPWRGRREDDLRKGDSLVVVYARNENTFQFTVTQPPFSWYDGPLFPIIHWREIAPGLDEHLRTRAQLIAEFGPTNAPYFRVYESQPQVTP